MATYQVKSDCSSGSYHDTLEDAEQAYFIELKYTRYVLLLKHTPGECAEIIRSGY